MTYQVLALKYRPQTFDELIGQETIIRTLKNAVSEQRLHHAYLFTGPRGVGKTSLARIFAKSLNCKQGPTLTPCQSCVPCREITESCSLDVQEIDGASHTSVDDIRVLRENVRYTPTTGRYRIYIIDEVHMLSKSAFAALLKTLEEPPEHVCFIFATTDPGKIPATILSRVLRFDFYRLSVRILVEHLKGIVTKENIEIDREGLSWIARCSEGSVRDALSLLDRLNSFAGNTIHTQQIMQVLGITGQAAVIQLLHRIIDGETEAALKQVGEIYENGNDIKQFGHELLEAIRDLLFFKVLGPEGFPDWSDQEIGMIAELSEKSEASDAEYLFHLFYQAYREMMRSPLVKILLEIAIIRLCTREKRETMSQLLEKLDAIKDQAPGSLSDVFKQEESAQQTSLLSDDSNEAGGPSFADFLKFVQKRKPSLAPILARASYGGEQNGRIQLIYPKNPAYGDMLRDSDRQNLVFDLGKEYFNKEVTWVSGDVPETAPEPQSKDQENSSIVEEAVSIFQPAQTKTLGARPDRLTKE